LWTSIGADQKAQVLVRVAKKLKSARPPGSTKPHKRAMETAAWKAQWEAARKVHTADSYAHLETYVAGKCDGYRYLFTIYSRTHNELLGEALSVLQVLKLDGADWRRTLDRVGRLEVGGSFDDLALGSMRSLIEQNKWPVKRAAEISVGQFGLYMDSNSFEAAVQRARQVWIAYKQGKFRPLSELANSSGLVVKPNAETLKPDEVRRVLDPSDQKSIPAGGKRVPDTPFWRNMIDLGLVVIIDDEL